MNGTARACSYSAIWRCLPLGILIAGVVFSPLLYHIFASPEGEAGVWIYLAGAFSAVLGFLFVLLLFLWVCQWMTEELERPPD